MWMILKFHVEKYISSKTVVKDVVTASNSAQDLTWNSPLSSIKKDIIHLRLEVWMDVSIAITVKSSVLNLPSIRWKPTQSLQRNKLSVYNRLGSLELIFAFALGFNWFNTRTFL